MTEKNKFLKEQERIINASNIHRLDENWEWPWSVNKSRGRRVPKSPPIPGAPPIGTPEYFKWLAEQEEKAQRG